MNAHPLDIELPSCPICGSRPELYKNASCRFTVKCTACGEHTEWTTKAKAIAQWYEKVIRVLRVLRSKA